MLLLQPIVHVGFIPTIILLAYFKTEPRFHPIQLFLPV